MDYKLLKQYIKDNLSIIVDVDNSCYNMYDEKCTRVSVALYLDGEKISEDSSN